MAGGRVGSRCEKDLRHRCSKMWGHKQALERGPRSSWKVWEGAWAASGNKDQPPAPFIPPQGRSQSCNHKKPIVCKPNRLFVDILNKPEYSLLTYRAVN